MVKKIFTYRGKTLEELQAMSIKEFAELLPARRRRTIKRGFTEAQKIFLKKLEKSSKDIKTQCRDMIILPSMVGKTIKIHNGKAYVPLTIQDEMIGFVLGEFVMTRNRVAHSAPGVGATKSSASVSVR